MNKTECHYCMLRPMMRIGPNDRQHQENPDQSKGKSNGNDEGFQVNM